MLRIVYNNDFLLSPNVYTGEVQPCVPMDKQKAHIGASRAISNTCDVIDVPHWYRLCWANFADISGVIREAYCQICSLRYQTSYTIAGSFNPEDP